MDISSRKTIHMGVNFLLAPMPVVDRQFGLAFQRFLIESGVAYNSVEQVEMQISVVREKPTPLSIQIKSGGQVGQLLIVASPPERALDAFIREADGVVRAFEIAAETGPRQIVGKDASIRDLFDSGGEHAFQEIWERFLERPPQVLDMLERHVLGGGLRFVMPSKEGEPDPVQIELKIESFLRDTSKIFFETQFSWPQPSPPGTQIMPGELLKEVDRYIVRISGKFAGGEQ